MLISVPVQAINPLVIMGVSDDKAIHACLSYALTDVMSEGWKWTPVQCALGIGLISVCKEGIDVLFGGEWDDGDIMANYAGWGTYYAVRFEF